MAIILFKIDKMIGINRMKKIAWSIFRRLPLDIRRRVLFFKNHRRLLNVKMPSTFNEKVNWRILNDRRAVLSWTCDKLQMKIHASNLSNRVLIPKTLWAGVDLRELDHFKFPERWILKANHRSQCVYIGVGRPEVGELQVATRGWLDRIQEEHLGEWAYSKADPCFILEEWIGDGDLVPEDYKLFVFDGSVKMIQVDTDRFVDHKIALYDRNWTRVDAGKNLWLQAQDSPKPVALELMISIAEDIGRGYDFMRIDLFATRSGIYFGETTPYPGGGLSPFDPIEFDLRLGKQWTLPRV